MAKERTAPKPAAKKPAAGKGKTKPAPKTSPKRAGAGGGTRTKSKGLSAEQLAELVGVAYKPPLKSADVQRLRRALPGYVNLLDDVAELVEDDASVLGVKGVSAADLVHVQKAHKELSTREAVLNAVYTSVYHQRLLLDHEGIGMLQKLARRVTALAEDHPDLPLRYKSLLDFLGTFRGGGRPAKDESPEGESTDSDEE